MKQKTTLFLFAALISLTSAYKLQAQCSPGFTYSQSANNVLDFNGSFTGNCGTNPTYLWDFGDQNGSSFLQAPSHTYNVPGTYTVCVTVSDSVNQFISAQYCAPVTVTGTVICNMNAYIYTLANPSCTTCADGQLFGAVTGGSGPYTYLWNNGGTTQTISNLLPGYYQFTVTDTNNCSATANGMQLDTVGPPPNCTTTWTNTMPQPNEEDFTISTMATAGMFTWDFGDNTGGTGSNPTHTYAYTGTYNVCVNVWDSATGCTSQFCDTVNVLGNNAACAAQYYSYTDSMRPDTLFIVNNSLGATPITFTWYWGDNTSSVGANLYHAYATSGTYNVCLVIHDNAGCTDSICMNQYVARMSNPAFQNMHVIAISTPGAMSVPDVQNSAMISVYPNPAQNELNLKSDISLNGQNYTIIDLTGRTVMGGKISEAVINISELTPGMYMLQLTSSNGGSSTHRFIKN
ncbi:MAG TPA: PKD domain-containing protein [Bacteroidia bacterium]|jgi:PKD repeat protein|nr:PKD domain-containing protein [Bacteroidia bacterium]